MTTTISVLIVEDEPLISMMLEEFVESLGCEVFASADTVEEAVAHVDGGGFALAILDVHLRDSAECWPVADALNAKGIPFVLSTGGHVREPPARYAAVPTLSKPFTMADVRDCLVACGFTPDSVI